MPDVRDYEIDDHLDVDEPTRLKALGDPLRMQLCDLVLERAMTVTELSERTERPKGTVAYHIDVLVDAGLLKVVRTRRVRAIDERFYGRTARTFVYPDAPGAIPFLRDFVADVDTERLNGAKQSRSTMATLRRARIPAERAAEYCRRLNELTLEFVDEPREGDIEYGLYVALYPSRRTTP